MKNLFVIFGLCTVLATETLAAKTQTAEGDRACREEGGRFTYDHPTLGRLTELTQAGLDSMRASAGESTTSAKPIGECPEPKISNVEAIKNWFKRVTDNDEQVNGEKRPTGPSTEDAKSTHTAKSGDFRSDTVHDSGPRENPNPKSWHVVYSISKNQSALIWVKASKLYY